MNIVIWGTGAKCKELVPKLKNCLIVAFIESQPRSETFMGVRVCTLNDVKEESFELLLITVKKAADIERKLYESYPSILKKSVCLFIDEVNNIEYFFKQYKLVQGVIDEAYLMECYRSSIEELRYNYRVMQLKDNLNIQEERLLQYAKKRGHLQKLNYPFTEKYLNLKCDVKMAQNGMYYISHLGRDIYFPRSWNRKKIICYWYSCMMENDKESPLWVEMDIDKQGGAIVEIENAVPIWSIKYLDICKSVYILNRCEEWQEALKVTFADSLDKCHIIKEVSAIEEFRIYCCKINEEENLFALMTGLLGKFDIDQFIISVFYHDSDVEQASRVLSKWKYDISLVPGYVYYPYNADIIGEFRFRRGILMGESRREE